MKLKYIGCLGLLAVGFLTSIQTYAEVCNGHAELCKRPWNRVTYVEAHNVSRAPSVVNNQNLTVPQLLGTGVRSIKVPLHWQKDQGAGKGENPTVCHGIYRSTFYGDYFNILFEGIEGPLNKLAQVRLLKNAVQPLLDLITMYKKNLKGLAEMERVARQKTFGSSTKAALVPYTPCVLDPSAQPFSAVLADIKRFLAANPREVVTLRVENVIENWDVIANEFKKAGLDTFAHAQHKTKVWPTLGEMINSGKRLVIFIKRNGPNTKYPWMNYERDFFWESNYSFSKKSALTADTSLPSSNSNFVARAQAPKNKVFILSNFITFGFAGSKTLAKEVNTRDVLTKRFQNIAVRAGQQPTLLGLDFVELPNRAAFDFVDNVNGVGKYKGSPLFAFPK